MMSDPAANLRVFRGRAGVGLLAAAVLSGTSTPALAQYVVVPPPVAPVAGPPPREAAPPRAALDDAGRAVADAQMDADLETSGLGWFGVGCLLSVGGVLIGYLVTPEPEAARLVGKPPAYVAAYTDAYRREGRSYQGIHAIYGCVTAAVVDVAFYFLARVIAGVAAAVPAG